MLFIERRRVVIRCDHCPVRLDLGPDHIAGRARMPSGWLSREGGEHMCPLCSAPRLVQAAKAALA